MKLLSIIGKYVFRAAGVITILLSLGIHLHAQNEARSFSMPSIANPVIPKYLVRLTDFGGVGDGKTTNTMAFEHAFAALTERGGGRLDVPAGIWFTGPIKLRSNAELHLESGALVKFSPDDRLYPLAVIDTRGEKVVASTSPISGQHLENIAITGPGIIDGNGEAWRPLYKNKVTDVEWKNIVTAGGVLSARGDAWWPSRDAMLGEQRVAQLVAAGSLALQDYESAHQFLRPQLVRLIDCKKVLIEGVTLQNPPFWTLNPQLCEDLTIRSVTVRNATAAQNSDALDLESCRRVIVLSCIFDVGDDGICLKSGKDAVGRRIGVPTEDVMIENCTVYHAHGGFVIGSEMSGGVRNVRVRNCTFIGTDIGLRFKSTRGRGGTVENIDISDIRMTDIAGDAINFNMFYAGASPRETPARGETATLPLNEGTPQFRNIRISNVICRGAQGAMTLEGLPEMPLKNVTLNNVEIQANHGVSVIDADGVQFQNVRIDCAGEKYTSIRAKNTEWVIQEVQK